MRVAGVQLLEVTTEENINIPHFDSSGILKLS